MAGLDRLWPDLAAFGRVWPDMAGFSSFSLSIIFIYSIQFYAAPGGRSSGRDSVPGLILREASKRFGD